MAAFDTYTLVGDKEDVSDVISNISPTATPFQSLVKTERVSNTVFQWQEDELASVADNAQLEGFTAEDDTLSPTTMRQNFTQIMAKVVNVSATVDAVSTYGRAKETAYQLAKKSAEIKREFEFHLVGKQQDADAGDNSNARTFANAFGEDVASNPVIHDDVTVDASGALTEDDILEVNQALYEAGSEASYIMVKPADSLIVAGFDRSASRTRTVNDNNKTIVNAVDLYVSPFGEQKVIINRFIKATEALVFDPKMWSICVLRPWTRQMLAKAGDSERHLLVGEMSLKHKNYKGTGRITGLTGDNNTIPSGE